MNIEHTFSDLIQWDEMAHGKLWAYHLNYFDFLLDDNMTSEQASAFIHDYIRQWPDLQNGHEPFPTSLRIINWIKATIKYSLEEVAIREALFQQAYSLYKNPEYHLLGNHLLENGFALVFAGYYLNHDPFMETGHKILLQEIDRQILSDGGHAERSTMYHSLILYRMLDTVNLLKSNPLGGLHVLNLLQDKAGQMLAWLKALAYSDSSLPWVNDSTEHQAPTLPQLESYAERLEIPNEETELGISGYRKIRTPVFEMLIDVGPIGLDHQPGHAHADTFSFEVFHKGKIIIADTGTSTYEEGPIRDYERSTAAHNTVEVAQRNSSDVWKSFRVGQRAEVIHLQEAPLKISASHNGYKSLGATHTRIWEWSDSSITITDVMEGRNQLPSKAFFHFSPQILIQTGSDNIVMVNDSIRISFTEDASIIEKKKLMSEGFNKRSVSQCLEVTFKQKLVTHIVFTPE